MPGNSSQPDPDIDTPQRVGVLENLMAKVGRVPSAPTLYFQLLDLIRDADASISMIDEIVSKDMAMTATILKQVNTVYFGLRHRVSNTSEAMNYLGVETVRSLVLSAHAFSDFKSIKIKHFSSEALSNHSLETATAAKAIARKEKAPQNVLDEAFVAGLLHDIGKLILAANFSAEFEEVLQITEKGDLDFSSAERQVFGVDHCDVGSHLLNSWGLPLPIVDAVASHHEPARSNAQAFGVLTAIHVANAMVHDARGSQMALDMAHLEKLGLSGRVNTWRDAVAATFAEKNFD